MKTKKTPAHEERRHAPNRLDPVLKLLILLSVSGWCALVLSLVLFHYARPEIMTGLMTYWNMQVREHWLESYSVYLLISVTVTVVISAVGSLMRRKRIRRRGDAIWLNLPVLLVISGGLLIYLLRQLQ